jgi:integrase
VRAARHEQDAAIFLTAAFTGLRMGELRALRWSDVDFARSLVRVYGSFCNGNRTTPKNDQARSVPLAPDVASALARLAQTRWSTHDDDLVFPGDVGDFFDDSALRRRCLGRVRGDRARPGRAEVAPRGASAAADGIVGDAGARAGRRGRASSRRPRRPFARRRRRHH